MSKRLAPAAIISMAQQARPNVIGQMLDCRAQLIACSTVVVMTFSSKRPSIHGWVMTQNSRAVEFKATANPLGYYVCLSF